MGHDRRGVELGRIVKSVSLDEQTAAIADNIGNFSKFVRGRLIAYDNTTKATAIQTLEHNAPRTIRTPASTTIDEGVKVCFPFHMTGCCVLCWPDGPPMRGGWLEWSAGIKEGLIHAPKPKGEGWHDGEVEIDPKKPKSMPPELGFWERLLDRFKES